VLNQEHNTITAPTENGLLAKVLLEIARIESRAADATTSSRCWLARYKLCTGRWASSTTHISRPA
jgi:hypothetical protein